MSAGFFCLQIFFEVLMIKKILKGYGTLFSGIIKILLLFLLCLAAGTVFVVPLWHFASVSPKIYTAVVLSLSSAILLFLLIKHFKSRGFTAFLISAGKLLCPLLFLVVSAILILDGKVLAVIPLFILCVILYGLIAFTSKHSPRSTKKNDFQED